HRLPQLRRPRACAERSKHRPRALQALGRRPDARLRDHGLRSRHARGTLGVGRPVRLSGRCGAQGLELRRGSRLTPAPGRSASAALVEGESMKTMRFSVTAAAFGIAIGLAAAAGAQPADPPVQLGALAPANLAKPRPAPPFDLTGTWQ